MKRVFSIIVTILMTAILCSGCGTQPTATGTATATPVTSNGTGAATSAASATPAPDVDPSTVDSVCEKWVMQEVTFQAQGTYSDPFNEVTLDVQYTAPSGKEYTVPAFWDGDNLWKVRFAPTEEGMWKYKTVCNVSDAGLTKSGTLGCNYYKGDKDIYKHGFVTVQNNNRYFTYADGTPFFYLGDTHWNMLSEEWDSAGSNAGSVQTESHFKYIVDARVQQGFTVYQSEPINAKYNLANGFSKNDLRGFQNIDQYFGYIAQQGLVHANAELFFTEELCKNFSSYSTAYLQQLARYWVARYSAYPVLWTVAQEADDDFFAGSVHNAFTKANNPWKTVAKAILQYDSYQHPLSCHMEGSVTAADSAFIDIPGYNWVASQTYTKRLWPQDFTSAKKNYNSCNYPVIYYEGSYENLWTMEFGARVQGWAAYLNGMCGYGYGVGDIWYYKSAYNMDEDTVQEETITKAQKQVKWGDTIHNANSVKLGYIKSFFQAFDWWKLTPCFDDNRYFKINKTDSTFAFGSNIGNTHYVIYCYNKSKEADLTVLNMDDNATYTARWYDANTGTFTTINNSIKSSGGQWNPGDKPSEADYVLDVVKSA